MSNLVHAGRALATDLLPTLVFAALIALKVDVVVATVASMAVSVGQIALQVMLRRPVAPLQWASLGLVVTFGAAGVLTHDPRFLMAKPTLVYATVGAVMLKRGWMLRYLPPAAVEHGRPAQIVFGYVWAALMFATAAANLVIATAFPALWPAFLASVPTASKIVLFAVQFVTVRHIAIRNASVVSAPQAA